MYNIKRFIDEEIAVRFKTMEELKSFNMALLSAVNFAIGSNALDNPVELFYGSDIEKYGFVFGYNTADGYKNLNHRCVLYGALPISNWETVDAQELRIDRKPFNRVKIIEFISE